MYSSNVAPMYEMKYIYLKNGQGRYALNEFSKVNEKGTAEKNFLINKRKIAERNRSAKNM